MRYAVFSDVHANLEAFDAILAYLKNSHIDKCIFLGDIVGYGADPIACITRLQSLDAVSVVGNHDWATIGKTNTDSFNEFAQSAILWTKKNIRENDWLFLSALDLVKDVDTCCVAVHGTLHQPQDFGYMSDAHLAKESFVDLKRHVCFVGHSHHPGVFVDDHGMIQYRECDSIFLEEDKRYIINDGSVGQPRDGDPRACVCVYDDASQVVTFNRINYDVALAQEKIIKAGLPQALASRLSIGR